MSAASSNASRIMLPAGEVPPSSAPDDELESAGELGDQFGDARSEPGQCTMLAQPVVRQQSHRSVAELDERLASLRCRQQRRDCELLAAVIDASIELEPVDTGADGDRDLRCTPVSDAPGFDVPAGREAVEGFRDLGEHQVRGRQTPIRLWGLSAESQTP